MNGANASVLSLNLMNVQTAIALRHSHPQLPADIYTVIWKTVQSKRSLV